jgi:hypothetical protein
MKSQNLPCHVFIRVTSQFTQHRQWRKQRHMNIINYFFLNKLNKSCFNLMIVSIGMLENLEPVTMLEKSWNDMSSNKGWLSAMVLLKAECVGALPAKGSIGYFG